MREILTKATFTRKTDRRGRTLSEAQQRDQRFQVHFNPETLQLTLTNTVQKGSGRRPAQTVTESSAKLSMDLIFDTTRDGRDVREKTHEIAQLMDPAQTTVRRNNQTQTREVPAIVIFEWGTIKFEGYIDSYKESIDFFSSEGVPFRATVSISLTQQERTFEPSRDVSYNPSSVQGQLALSTNAQSRRPGANESVTDTARAAGDSSAARRLASQNGIENPRFPEKGEIVVIDELTRNPVAFSSGISGGISAGVGLGAGISAGVSAGAGFSAGISTGISAGVGLGAGVSFSAQASAKLSATEKAFAGLHTQVSTQIQRPRARLGFEFDAPVSANIGIGAKTNFSIGGKPSGVGSASLSADVGINADIDLGISFEE